MHGWNDGWSWGAWLAMGFLMVVVWGGIVALVVVAVRSFGHRAESADNSTQGDRAQQILDERLAQGEIDVEEYRHRRDVLQP